MVLHVLLITRPPPPTKRKNNNNKISNCFIYSNNYQLMQYIFNIININIMN